MARWQEFEQLAQKILAELQPRAKVVWNDSIYGHLTQSKRQIDVSIRWKEGSDEYLVVVQARDTSDPADVNVVGEFSSVIRDVTANKGILICRSGFSKSAHTYARNCGISLFNLHDAQSVNWSLQLTIPILWVELTPVISTHVVVYLEAGDTLPTDDPLGMPLTYGEITTRIDPMSTFKRYWNGPHAKRTLDVDHYVQAEKPVKAIVRDAAQAIVTRDVQEFAIKYNVEQRAWLGQFQPAECRGIVDYLDQSAFLASYLSISELPFRRDDHWELIEDVTKVAVNLRGTVVTTERIVLIDELTSAQLSVMYLGPNR